MLPTLQAGPLAISTPGIVLLFGLYFGLLLSERRAPSRGLSPNRVYQISAIILASGLVGARLSYILLNWPAFRADLVSIFSLNYKLLDPWGGFMAGLVILLGYSRKTGLPLGKIFDTFTPTLSALTVAAHLAHFASGSGFGIPANVPWAIEFLGAKRHPFQIYEAVTGLLILILVFRLDTQQQAKTPEGTLFLTFVTLSAASQLFWEAFRADSPIGYGGLRLTQITAWIILSLSLWLLGKRLKLIYKNQP